MAVLDQQEDGALQVDLYELPMSAGYFRYRPDIRATFNLSVIPFLPQRNYYVFVEAGFIATN